MNDGAKKSDWSVPGNGECPACGQQAVVRDGKTPFGFAQFRCSTCNAPLQTAFRWRMLWTIPIIALLMLPLAAILMLVRDSALPQLAKACLFGGIPPLFFGLSVRYLVRLIGYKVDADPARQRPS